MVQNLRHQNQAVCTRSHELGFRICHIQRNSCKKRLFTWLLLTSGITVNNGPMPAMLWIWWSAVHACFTGRSFSQCAEYCTHKWLQDFSSHKQTLSPKYMECAFSAPVSCTIIWLLCQSCAHTNLLQQNHQLSGLPLQWLKHLNTCEVQFADVQKIKYYLLSRSDHGNQTCDSSHNRLFWYHFCSSIQTFFQDKFAAMWKRYTCNCSFLRGSGCFMRSIS